MTAALDATIGGLFVSAARDYPARTFLAWCRGAARVAWTYAEAAARVDAMVARLDALGIERGDHVVVYTAEMVPSIVFELACACAGVIFTPIETSSRSAVLALCARVRAKAVLTTPDRAGALDLPALTEDGLAACPPDPDAVARLAARAVQLDGDTVYMLQPTSGTTAESKLVVRHHAVFVRITQLMAFGRARADEPAERVLMVAAMTHGMGQYQLAIAMALGAALCVTTQLDTGADLAEVRELDPTHVTLTPRVLRSLVAQHGAGNTARMFGPAAKFYVSSGSAVDPALMAVVQRDGLVVIDAYGASEVSVVSMTRPGQWRPGSGGHVLADCKLRITEDGELEAWTPVMMRGYFEAPEVNARVFTPDGFYRTGDRVAIDGEGELRYLGRVVDTFNLFDGSNVAPGATEDAIDRLPWVDQVVLLGDQRPYLTALIVPHPAARASAGLRALVERDVGRIGAALDPNARVRRVALLAAPFPAEVHQVVGHGKVRRGRAKAAALYADTVAALYGDGTGTIDIPGGAAERRAASRQPVAWLVAIGETTLAYTRDASRTGAFVAAAAAAPSPIAALLASAPAAAPPTGRVVVELVEAERLAVDAEVVRAEAGGFALRWLGPPEALAVLARRLPP